MLPFFLLLLLLLLSYHRVSITVTTCKFGREECDVCQLRHDYVINHLVFTAHAHLILSVSVLVLVFCQ